MEAWDNGVQIVYNIMNVNLVGNENAINSNNNLNGEIIPNRHRSIELEPNFQDPRIGPLSNEAANEQV